MVAGRYLHVRNLWCLCLAIGLLLLFYQGLRLQSASLQRSSIGSNDETLKKPDLSAQNATLGVCCNFHSWPSCADRISVRSHASGVRKCDQLAGRRSAASSSADWTLSSNTRPTGALRRVRRRVPQRASVRDNWLGVRLAQPSPHSATVRSTLHPPAIRTHAPTYQRLRISMSAYKTVLTLEDDAD